MRVPPDRRLVPEGVGDSRPWPARTSVSASANATRHRRIRKADEKPAAPDVYPIERGIVRLSAGHESLPVIDRIKAALRER
jgi:hypothetical protein